MGDFEGAKQGYSQAIKPGKPDFFPVIPFLAYGYHNLASILLTQDRPAEALPHFQYAHEIRTKQLAPDNPQQAITTSMLGDCLATLGRIEEAEPLLIEGYQSLLASRGEEHTGTQEAATRLKTFLRDQNR